MALTQKEIIGLKAKTSSYYRWDDGRTRGAGRLGVKVQASGSKSFVFRFYRDTKRVFMLLGKFPELSLTKARDKANRYGAMLKEGLDPKEESDNAVKVKQKAKQEEDRKGTLEQLFNSYTKQMEKDGKRTFKAVLSSLTKEVYPHIPPATKAKDVAPLDLITVLAHMIRRGAMTQSNRVRSYLMAAFNHGLKHDNDPANYIDDAKFGLLFNPVAGIPKQKNAEKVGNHYLSNSEVKQLLWDLEHDFTRFKMGDTVRNLIRLCFYTGGQRPYELVASKLSCINWDKKTMLITADVSKSKRPHLVPLTDTAMNILQKQSENAGGSEFIFPHRFDLAQHLRTDSLSQGVTRYREISEIRHFIPRDIRRTCKTLMGELGISKHIRDRLQNHALQDVSSKHYDRYEYEAEKRIALASWEKKLNDVATDNVLVMKTG
jgi:integrase